eukprot:TRINITY_DN2978_c0_g1_i1.p3 TRINITY_DN2978_c0_g1~~TRINITY_DN2978_c0_g1_i1.p3  ORF type:complete len:116 (+),score=24.10 TRINITY_DN2978_c0_g1_i1:53-400(+)
MMKATRAALALKPTLPKAATYGKWDTRLIGEMVRPFNWRELPDGYHSHLPMGWIENSQGKASMYAQSFSTKFFRGYVLLAFTWFFGWGTYYINLSERSAGCPWSTDYDPSRERSF